MDDDTQRTVCTIIPPYLLHALADRGAMDPEAVKATLRIDAQIRGRRVLPVDGVGTGDPEAAGDAGPDATAVPRWIVHDGENVMELPGTPVRAEGEPEAGDDSVEEAADGITATLNLFRDAYGRDSFDGEGAVSLLTVHYGQDYANAFWDGAHLVFGDGDGRIFGRFTAALDVLAHEFAHAVTEGTAGLVYRGQSGALNESMSDVFGACVKQAVLGQDAASGDWLIGDGIFVEGIRARALRDMANPGTAYDDPQLGKDPQPAHMDDYVQTNDDNGGVHINSGIPNRAFVLAAQAIGGSTAEGAGRIWYATLDSGDVRPNADFTAFAAATVTHAGEHADAVRAGWEAVGVVPGGEPVEPGSPTPAPEGLPTDPAPTDPAPSEPAPGDPAPSEPAPSEPAPSEPAPTGPAPSEPAPSDTAGEVVVRRTGGFAGQTVEGALDLASEDPRAPRARELVERCDLTAVPSAPSQPDRFVYDVRVGRAEAQVPEQELTGDLAELVRLVLDEPS